MHQNLRCTEEFKQVRNVTKERNYTVQVKKKLIYRLKLKTETDTSICEIKYHCTHKLPGTEFNLQSTPVVFAVNDTYWVAFTDPTCIGSGLAA